MEGKSAPCINPGVIPYTEEESKYLPEFRDMTIPTGFSPVITDRTGISFLGHFV